MSDVSVLDIAKAACEALETLAANLIPEVLRRRIRAGKALSMLASKVHVIKQKLDTISSSEIQSLDGYLRAFLLALEQICTVCLFRLLSKIGLAYHKNGIEGHKKGVQ